MSYKFISLMILATIATLIFSAAVYQSITQPKPCNSYVAPYDDERVG